MLNSNNKRSFEYIPCSKGGRKFKWYYGAEHHEAFNGKIEYIDVFKTIISLCNYKDDEDIKRGECLTSLNELVIISKSSKRQVRTALNRMEERMMIKTKKTNKGTLIKVLNYNKYQSQDEQEIKYYSNHNKANVMDYLANDTQTTHEIKSDTRHTKTTHEKDTQDNIFLNFNMKNALESILKEQKTTNQLLKELIEKTTHKTDTRHTKATSDQQEITNDTQNRHTDLNNNQEATHKRHTSDTQATHGTIETPAYIYRTCGIDKIDLIDNNTHYTNKISLYNENENLTSGVSEDLDKISFKGNDNHNQQDEDDEIKQMIKLIDDYQELDLQEKQETNKPTFKDDNQDESTITLKQEQTQEKGTYNQSYEYKTSTNSNNNTQNNQKVFDKIYKYYLLETNYFIEKNDIDEKAIEQIKSYIEHEKPTAYEYKSLLSRILKNNSDRTQEQIYHYFRVQVIAKHKFFYKREQKLAELKSILSSMQKFTYYDPDNLTDLMIEEGIERQRANKTNFLQTQENIDDELYLNNFTYDDKIINQGYGVMRKIYNKQFQYNFNSEQFRLIGVNTEDKLICVQYLGCVSDFCLDQLKTNIRNDTQNYVGDYFDYEYDIYITTNRDIRTYDFNDDYQYKYESTKLIGEVKQEYIKTEYLEERMAL